MRTNKSLATTMWKRAESLGTSDDPKAKLAANCLHAAAMALDVVDLPDMTIDDVAIGVNVSLRFAGLNLEMHSTHPFHRKSAERFTSDEDAERHVWNVFGDAICCDKLSGQALQDAVLKECGNSERLKAIAMRRMTHTYTWAGWLEDFHDPKWMAETFQNRKRQGPLTGDEDIQTARAKVKAWLEEPELETVD